MNGFLAVSLGAGAREGLRRPVNEALACLAEGNVTQIANQDGWIAFSGAANTDRDRSLEGRESFAVALGHLLRARDGDRSPEALGPLVASGDSSLAKLLPPFAIVQRTAPKAPIHAAVDWLGFFQLYIWQGPGVAAISTSARALSVLAGGKLNEAAVGVQAMMGWQLGDATLFDGVRVVPAASIATLHRGTVSVRAYVDPLSFASSTGEPPALADAVEEMAAILRAALENYLAAHPEAVLQLTGGHDSRILLGAISRARRRGLRALTLGDQGSRDVAIAADLCRRYGMVHVVHRVDGQAWPSILGVHDLVMNSARSLECHASPIALAPLLLAETRIEQGYRLSGLGGEVARGFYYSGQPKNQSTSSALVRSLAEWRLCINEAVEPAALDPTFLATARAETIRKLAGLFPSGDWLRATDEFYLYQRMRRWAGAHGTVAAMHRESLNVMFDRRFIELALAVDPIDKRDSLLLGRLMSTLDSELAAIPLDIGLVPAQLGRKSIRTKVTVATLTTRRTVRKAWQRVSGGRRPQVGATAAAARLLQHWRASPDVCNALFDVPFIRRDWLHVVLSGSQDAKPTTLAFLANMLAAVAPRHVAVAA